MYYNTFYYFNEAACRIVLKNDTLSAIVNWYFF